LELIQNRTKVYLML